jgi:hypothetical protein
METLFAISKHYQQFPETLQLLAHLRKGECLTSQNVFETKGQILVI